MSINVSAARRVDRPDPRYVNSSQVFKESNNNQGDLAVPEVLRRRNNLLAAGKADHRRFWKRVLRPCTCAGFDRSSKRA
jgi:hypothetical protein